MRTIRHHHRALVYTILALLFMTSALFFFLFRFDPTMQFQILVLTLFGYVVWGLGYHWWEKSLSRDILIEYCLIAAFVLSIMFAFSSFR